MVNAIVVDPERETLDALDRLIQQYCPGIKVCGKAETIGFAQQLIVRERPELVLLEIDMPAPEVREKELLVNAISQDFETIVVTHLQFLAIEWIKFNVCGFVPKPVKSKDLVPVVAEAQRRLGLKEEHRQNKFLLDKVLHQLPHDELIGIPTMKGFDFIHVGDIIRCEGLQRCTRIVTTKQSNLVSSYNLGQFIKILEPFGFFSPHRSHLINLQYVKNYKREGTITMIDDGHIPVSRKKKQEFLNGILHL